MKLAGQDRSLDNWEANDEIIAAVTNCPLADCGSLVVEYMAADEVRPGHPEDWEFTCSRCGIEFTVTQGELILQSIPKHWLSKQIQVT